MTFSFQFGATGIRATWIGHATVLAEIDGSVIICDPIFRFIYSFNFKRNKSSGLLKLLFKKTSFLVYLELLFQKKLVFGFI